MRTEGEWDVIVVGAGIAGLTAAYELQEAGFRVVVLEARDRVGGRIHTIRVPFEEGQYAEAGAQYFEPQQRRANRYIDRFGLKREAIRSGHERAIFLDQVFSFLKPEKDALPEEVAKEITSNFYSYDAHKKFFQPLWDKLMNEHHNDEGRVWEHLLSISALEVLQESGASLEEISYLRMRMAPDEGVELDDVTAAALVFSKGWSNDYSDHMFQLEGGNDLLPQAFAERLKASVKLGCVVTSVHQANTHVEVCFTNGENEESLQGAVALFAIPPGPLTTLDFSPPLSEERRAGLQALIKAPVLKVLLQFDKRYWEEAGWNGNLTSEHPLCTWHATEHQDGESGILCFYIIASMVQQIHEMPEDEREGFLLSILQEHELLPDGVKPTHMLSFDWIDTPYTEGGWSVYPLGREDELIAQLIAPEGRCYFAGEHLPHPETEEEEDELINTMESAMSSGLAAFGLIKGRDI